MKKTNSGRRLIFPVFITHQGCPHRCVFCNQEVTTDQASGSPSAAEIQGGIISFLRATDGRPERREVAFYGGTFTALPFEDQKALLRGVHPFVGESGIDSIRVSTRPDAVEGKRLDLLRPFGVQTVEVGAQSMVDEVLKNSGRGHGSADVAHSVELTRAKGFEVGVQIMLGLPGEDLHLFLMTARRVIDLAPDFVRIYPLLVMRGAPLEDLYEQGVYTPLSLEQAVEWAKEALKLFEQARIPVIRMGLQSTPRLEASGTIAAGPYHPAFRSLVESSIFYELACRLLEKSVNGHSQTVRLRASPKDVSHVLGEKKVNLVRLKAAYGLNSVEIVSDPEIPKGRLLLEGSEGVLMVSREGLLASRNLSCL